MDLSEVTARDRGELREAAGESGRSLIDAMGTKIKTVIDGYPGSDEEKDAIRLSLANELLDSTTMATTRAD